jgi:hypothetical protein
VSLEGSLETVALPEVLQLLSDTSKTGELLVRGDRGEGRLWFGQGRLTGFQVARTDQAADALFDLLRNSEGRFEFQADAELPEDANHVGEDENEVRPVLDVAQARLAEWTEIVAIIPSLRHVVRLAEEAPRARLHLDAAQWSLVVAVGEGRAVEGILERASLPEFDGCKSLKVLVNSGLATVAEPVAEEVEAVVEPAAEVVEEPVAETMDEPFGHIVEEPVAQAADEPEPAESAEFAPVDAEEASVPEAPVYEAALDPHEYVFSAPVSSDEPAQAPAEEELAPWSVALADASPNGVDHDDFVPQHVPYPEVHDEHEGNGSNGARAALEALIAEIPAEDAAGEDVHEAPDGLADRGPWTSNELADMSNWHDEEHPSEVTTWGSFQVTSSRSPYDAESEDIGAAVGHEEAGQHYNAGEPETGDESDDQEEPEPQPEQVNRGLLLKFLSSVRS